MSRGKSDLFSTDVGSLSLSLYLCLSPSPHPLFPSLPPSVSVSLSVSLSLSVCAHTHARVRACVPICTQRPEQTMRVSSITFHPLRQGLSLSLGPVGLFRFVFPREAGNKQAPAILPQHARPHPDCWGCGYELRPSWLGNKYLSPLSCLSSPENF